MNKAVLILFAFCVGLGLLSLHLVNQMRSGQAQVAELQTQIEKLERERQENALALAQALAPAPVPMEPPKQVPPPAVTPNKETAKVAVVRPLGPSSAEAMFGGGPSREDRMRMMREARERQRQLMQDPEYREAMRVQQRSSFGRQYPGVSQELGLTTEQTDQLFDLLVDQQMRQSEQSELLWDNEGLDPAALQQRQEKMQQQWAEMQRKNDAELAATLGPDKLRSWKEYQSTLGARHQAEQLRTTLAGRGVPLTEDAGRAVVKAYAEAQKAEMQEYANMARNNAASSGKPGMTALRGYVAGPSSEMFERQLELTKKRNQRVVEALSPYLTYEQREALQKEQEAELKMQEAQMRIMRAQSKMEGNNGEVGWATSSPQAIILPSQR